MSLFVGRTAEKTLLKQALVSIKPELIAIYGRRRVGKTFLVRETYKKNITFEFSGVYRSDRANQLKSFYLKLSLVYPKTTKPKDWLEAFHQLSLFINSLRTKKKKVLFIDEFPWLDTKKSGFLSAFDNFWNSFASARKDIVIVICGSAASYIINNIINNKGGLHNRITKKINLSPFTLLEVEKFLLKKNISLTRYDIVLLYMAIGGIPFYLEDIQIGESIPQALDRMCFSRNGLLRTEFDNVFSSLFNHYENHEKIIRVLAGVRKGLTRNQLLSKSGFHSGGRLSKTLKELEESGFISMNSPFRGIKDSIYRLSDEYSMFYLKFIEKNAPSNTENWLSLQNKQSYKIWSGFSFENLCIKHVDQIKEGLKISGINSSHSSWIGTGATGGAQIDLLIDRDDNVISVCEMKFYNGPFAINKKYSKEISNKISVFKEVTKTKKNIFVTFITSFGLVDNKYKKQDVQSELELDCLFN